MHRTISELILEGFLYARQGKGTFVAPRPVETIRVLSLHPLASWQHSFIQMIEGMREKAFQLGILIPARPVQLIQPFRGMGRFAIQRLVTAMQTEAQPSGTDLLPCRIIPGDSVKTIA
jgi:Transcriptional regulators